MPWRYIDPFYEKLSRHTTIYGKYWLIFVTVFRLTVIPFAEHCWSDEQKEFKVICVGLHFNPIDLKDNPEFLKNSRKFIYKLIMQSKPKFSSNFEIVRKKYFVMLAQKL